MISIAATVAAMTACTGESDPIDELNPKDAKVEIKATAGIGAIDVDTKAAVEPKAALPDVAFVRIDGATLDWTTSNAITCTGDIAATTGEITFSTPQYYPQVDAANFICYYPNEALAAGVVSFTGLDGTKDIMCSEAVSTKRADNSSSISFDLAHKLTQLKFKVKATDQQAIDNWGTITSIELTNQKTSAKLTLSTGTLAFDGTADTPITILSGGSQALTTAADGVEIGDAILAEAGLSEYSIKVITSKNTEGTTIKLKDVAGVASTAYTITLTFKGKSIVSNGSIGEWIPDTNGSGEAE